MSIDKASAQQRSCNRMKQHEVVAARIRRKALRHPLLAAFLRDNVSEQMPIQDNGGHEMKVRSIEWIDDAFIRSTRPELEQTIYGIIADSSGVGYPDLLDALESGSPSGWMRTETLEPSEISALIARFREIGVSQHNWFPDEYCNPVMPKQSGILVDAEEPDFHRILQTALEITEGVPIYLRPNADIRSNKKDSFAFRKILGDSRVQFLSQGLSPAQCFSVCDAVMVGNSLLGMEALIHGKRVMTCGTPFFSGWGLTEDLAPLMASAKRRKLSLFELFEATYLQYCHYFDPDSGEPCGLGAILDHIELQKEMFRKNSGHWVTVGFSPWNRKIASAYLQSPAGHVSHANDFSELPNDARLLVWGRKTEVAENLRNRSVRVEDGFVRSKGLGATFNFPYSWALDETGIYFDASAPSDLENLYHNGFESSDLTEASELIQVLRDKRLTKYNLEVTKITLDEKLTQGRKIILVPGQVEADASILYGSPELKSNLDLLLRVRQNEPDAFVIFKAHPDLVAAARHGQVLPDSIVATSDLVVTDGNVLDWLEICDEVHTMTSTVGFEALIRNVPVVTYGLPFYAGWGLTKDHLTCVRRQRALSLVELVCGALIKYPRYLNPASGEFTTALKVARLLTSEKVATDRRAWHLRAISQFKKAWVKVARM